MKYRNFSYRIYPNINQIKILSNTFGCCRFLYNKMLTDIIEHYNKTGQIQIPDFEVYKEFYPWMREVDPRALVNVALFLKLAFKNYYTKDNMGFPKFKVKGKSRDSYTTYPVNNDIEIYEKHIFIPYVGKIKAIFHRNLPPDAQIKSATVIREPTDKYYICILVQFNTPAHKAVVKPIEQLKILGLDYSMKGMAVLSNGTCANNPSFYKQAQAQLQKESRILAHCQHGSKNYEKQKRKLARIHEKIRNQRKDYLHKVSTRFADEYDVIAVENINLRQLSRSNRFGKSIMDNGYGRFRQMIEYKAEERNKTFIRINKYFPSSKMCSRCGRIKEFLPFTQTIYQCDHCGLIINRDYNAAINIKNEAYRLLSN